jgi:3-hydroxyisobutyrate dehydrogenase-like beta-hydroxyacid dehydrogenase
MEKKIGFMGLGSMGIPMAKNLIDAGYHLQVYNRTIEKADELKSTSITKCKSPAEAAQNVEAVITMLAEDDALKNVVLGDEGLLKTLPKNAIHISMSTIGPDTSDELHQKHLEACNKYIAAPVFGRPDAAAERKLWIVISGDKDAKEKAKPILENLGQGIIDFGEKPGSANVIKISGNFMILASLEMMAEAYTLGEKYGLDRVKISEFFGSTLFNAPIFQNYGKIIANKQYQPVRFKTTLGYKDARLALKVAQQNQMPMPLVTLVHNRLLTSIAKGKGDRDWTEGISGDVSDDAGI